MWFASARYVNEEGYCVHSLGEGGAFKGRCWVLFVFKGGLDHKVVSLVCQSVLAFI